MLETVCDSRVFLLDCMLARWSFPHGRPVAVFARVIINASSPLIYNARKCALRKVFGVFLFFNLCRLWLAPSYVPTRSLSLAVLS